MFEGNAQFEVVKYSSKYFDEWNALVDLADGGTIYHRLDFLSYHKDRFKDNEQHLLVLKKNKIFGILPLAIFINANNRIAKSPYGGSYGGPVFSKNLNYENSKKIISLILGYLKAKDICCVSFTLPPSFCYAYPSDTFKFVLLNEGFACTNRDIESAIYLSKGHSIQQNITQKKERDIERKVKKSIKEGVTIKRCQDLNDFWKVLEITFQKHNTRPTHSRGELESLKTFFPGRVLFDVAYFNNLPIAGICLIAYNKNVITSFYMVHHQDYKEKQPLTYLIYNALSEACNAGFKWFNLGTSSVNMQARDNIFKFKESLGALGIFRETYEWKKEG